MRDKGVKRGKKKKKWGGRKLYLVMWLVGWVQSEVHDILCHATTICVMEGTDNRRKCTFAYVCIIFCLRGGPKQRHAGPPPPEFAVVPCSIVEILVPQIILGYCEACQNNQTHLNFRSILVNLKFYLFYLFFNNYIRKCFTLLIVIFGHNSIFI